MTFSHTQIMALIAFSIAVGVCFGIAAYGLWLHEVGVVEQSTAAGVALSVAIFACMPDERRKAKGMDAGGNVAGSDAKEAR